MWSKALAIVLGEYYELTVVWTSPTRGSTKSSALDVWRGQYIYCFRSLQILSQEQLNRASIGAINFHPGPPEYPGSGSTNLAIWEGAQKFGVTAHLMNAQVDQGPIIRVKRFKMAPNETNSSLLERTHSSLFLLAIDVIRDVVNGEIVLDRIDAGETLNEWSTAVRSIKEVDALREVNPSVITEIELGARIAAINSRSFPLYFNLHGWTFSLETDIPEVDM